MSNEEGGEEGGTEGEEGDEGREGCEEGIMIGRKGEKKDGERRKGE